MMLFSNMKSEARIFGPASFVNSPTSECDSESFGGCSNTGNSATLRLESSSSSGGSRNGLKIRFIRISGTVCSSLLLQPSSAQGSEHLFELHWQERSSPACAQLNLRQRLFFWWKPVRSLSHSLRVKVSQGAEHLHWGVWRPRQ